MDNIWDIIKSQPITNKLYEMNRLAEEIEKTKAKALRDEEDQEVGATKKDEPAFAVTLTREMKPTEEVRETNEPAMDTGFRVPRHTDTSV